jgi:hypothetical protein
MKRLYAGWLLSSALGMASISALAQDGGTGPDVTKLPFNQDSIRKVVQAHQPGIQECYEQILAGKADVVEGKLRTSWTITAEGLVKSARVIPKGSSIHDEKLNDCVVSVLTAMNFPKPPDGREHPIEYPFNLKAIR